MSKANELKGHYFPLPNELFYLGLSASEIAIYAYLSFIENRKTYTSWASYESIGRHMKLCKSTVAKYVKSLEEKQLIGTEHTKVKLRNGETHNGCLMYSILPINIAVSSYMTKLYEKFKLNGDEQKAKQKLEKYNRRCPQQSVCATFEESWGESQ